MFYKTVQPGLGPHRLLWSAVVLWASLLSAVSQTISKEPPAIYREHIEPWLTPIEAVLEAHAGKEESAEDPSGEILLQERFVYVFDDGRSVTAQHWIFRARNEGGIAPITEDAYGYRRDTETIHYVLGRTVQPDGLRIPVRENALILQTPQAGASQNLYSDRGELTIIFPDVKSGSVTETIVVIEEKEPRVPGEFMTHRTWNGAWPKSRVREAIELPGAMAGRLVITPRQLSAQPRHGVHLLENGRVRHLWETMDLKSRTYEYNAPSEGDTGPSTWMTTWGSWDALAAWYEGLLAGRDELSPDLARQVDEWTANATTREQIVEILTEKVTNEVRYTGLEFGLASLQPYDCNDVWANGYGDCKDKANLLRAMLRHKGIDAYIALLDTEDTGFLVAESPDYRQFNHAILALPQIDEHGYLFIDPTVPLTRPGVLSLGVLDRDVVVIRGGRADVTRTPRQDAGRITYRFDLELDRDGSLAGWMHLLASRYYACSFGRYFSDKSQDGMERAKVGFVRQWYAKAEVVDFKHPVLPDDDLKFESATYFIQKGTAKDAESVRLPDIGGFLPAFAKESRQRDLMLWHDHYGIEFQVAIPDGFTPDVLPTPFSVDAPNFRATGRWRYEPETLTLEAELTIRVEQGLVPSLQYPVLRQALASFHSWAGQAVSLLPGEREAEKRAVAEGNVLDGFTLMPTGRGQLALVNARYPESGNLTLRRKALERTIQLFPNEPGTLLVAHTGIAYLEYIEEDTAAAANRLRQALMVTPERNVDAEEYAWSEYLLGMCLEELGQTEEAVQLFDRVSGDETLGDHRRGWAYWRAGLVLATSEPEASLRRIEAGLDLRTEAEGPLYVLLAKVLIATDRQEELMKRLNELVGGREARGESDVVAIVETLLESTFEDDSTYGQALFEVLGDLEPPVGSSVAKTLDSTLGEAREKQAVLVASRRIQKEMRAFFSEQRPAFWDEVHAAEPMETRDDYIDARDAAEEDNQRELAAKMALRLLLEVDAGEHFDYDLWQAAVYLNWMAYGKGYSEDDVWLNRIFRWGEQLPEGSDHWHEMLITKASSAERMGKLGMAAATLSRLAEGTHLKPEYRDTVFYRYGRILERIGKASEALHHYNRLTGDASTVPACSALIREMYLCFRRGQVEEGLRILDTLSKADGGILEQADGATQAQELILLYRNGDPAAYFAHAEGWLESWRMLTEAVNAERRDAQSPIIEDYAALNKTLETYAGEHNGKRFCEEMSVLMDSARWLPSDAAHAIFVLYQVGDEAMPEKTEEVKRLAALMADGFPDHDIDHYRSAVLYGTAALIDLEAWEEALDLLKPCLQEGEDFVSNPDMHVLVRLYGLIAKRLPVELSQAAHLLEIQIAQGHLGDHRSASVAILAEVYEMLGKREEALNLLTDELESPALNQKESARRQLTAMQERLRAEGAGRSEFTAAVHDWMLAFRPSWYDFAEPENLLDPRMTDIEKFLEQPSLTFSAPEVVKACLLALQDESNSDATRVALVELMLDRYTATLADGHRRLKVIEAVVNDERFSPNARQRALILAIQGAEEMADWKTSRSYRRHPVFSRLTPDLRERIRPTEYVAGMENLDLDRRATLLQEYLRRGGLEAWSFEEARWVVERMVARGWFEAAEELIQFVRNTKEKGESPAHSALILTLLRELRAARESFPLQEALREEVFRFFPAERIAKPRRFDDFHGKSNAAMPADEMVAFDLYALKSRFRLMDASFWAALVRHLGQQDEDKANRLGIRLLEKGLELIDQDVDRAAWLGSFAEVLDFERSDRRREIMRACEPYRWRNDAPLTKGAIKSLDLRLSLKDGAIISEERLIQPNPWPKAMVEETFMRLSRHLQTKNKDAVRRILESAELELLLSVDLIPFTVRAYSLLGFREELEIAREQLERSWYEQILKTWAEEVGQTMGESSRVLVWRETVPDLPEPPRAWLDHLVSLPNHFESTVARMQVARQNKNWLEVLAAAEAILERYPSHYGAYWYAGEASLRLDRMHASERFLRAFIERAKDDARHFQAVQLVDALALQTR